MSSKNNPEGKANGPVEITGLKAIMEALKNSGTVSNEPVGKLDERFKAATEAEHKPTKPAQAIDMKPTDVTIGDISAPPKSEAQKISEMESKRGRG